MNDPLSILWLHDPGFVAMAAAICLLSGQMAQPILDRVASASNSVSWFWIAASGVIVGSTIWSVHFIAILALDANTGQHHDKVWTLGSLLVSILGMMGMASTMRFPAGPRLAAVKATTFVGAIGVMHYSGTQGVHTSFEMTHKSVIVSASLALALLPAYLFVHAADRVQSRQIRLVRTTCFVLTVLTVHFGGMVAMEHGAHMHHVDGTYMLPETFTSTILLVTVLVLMFGASIVYLEKRNFELFEQRSQEGQFINFTSGTINRAGIVREIDALIAKDQPFTLIGLSLVGYREARDLVGRATLRQWVPDTARRIQTAAQPNGTVAYAGSGFFYVLQRTGQDGLPMETVETWRKTLGGFHMMIDGRQVDFETALGVVHYPADAHRAEDLVDYCDFAIDCAASAGKSTLARFEKDRLDERTKRQRLAVDIRQALRRGTLELHYQPQGRIDKSNGAPVVTGFEALARWTHPKLGRVPPDVFVPLCEAGGLNPELAEWALNTACAEFAVWDTDHTVAVNIPPELLSGSSLIEMVRNALGRTGLAPSRLEIEVTESGIIADKEAARLSIDALHDLGVRVSLDDFGTGNASLQTLFEIPLDKIKLDRMFLPADASDARSLAIVEATGFIASRLGADVLAEGVETKEQLSLLRKIGYGSIQGYYIAPALPADEARKRFLHSEVNPAEAN